MQIAKGFRLGLAASVSVAALASAAQSRPDGPGRTEFERLCGTCHTLERSTAKRLTVDQWSAVVDEMAARGIESTSDDLRRVATYLGEHFGPDAPAPPKRVNINAADASELVDALSVSTADADAIVRYRNEHGVFRAWDDLTRVPGIDTETLEAHKSRIAFGEKKE